MPSLGGATGWLNSEPLGPAELQGKVVLVDFWTYTCINWLRTLPYIRAWAKEYENDGLVVLGVHTPEFPFEQDLDNVRRAVEDMQIEYPVALDSDYAIWDAFANRYWPALYFVDREGAIRDHHFGEGRYEQSERVIQQLLAVDRELVSVDGLGAEAAADWDDLDSPETYLGDAARRAPHGRPARLIAAQPLVAVRRLDDPGAGRRPERGRGRHRVPLSRPRPPSRPEGRGRARSLPRHPGRRRAR